MLVKNFSSVIPAPSQPKTSQTVIRRPRMQGFPPRLPGSIVMRVLTVDTASLFSMAFVL